MEEVVIRLDSVYKDFMLPHEKINSVKGIVTSITKGNPWKVKETQHTLKDINFEIKKGEFFGVVGRNGSGKSTLLKILANIYQPTKGKVYTNGKLVPFIELGVGFNPELTGRENVYLNGAMLGFSDNQIDKMYDDIVEFAELKRFMDQKLKNYSSGMQVRLAFSMATRSEADILLIDEVLAVGDADFQRKCFEYFKTLKKNGKTVVFVSHDMNAVREYCDRTILIEKSRIIFEGNSDKVSAQYTKLFTETTSKSTAKNEDSGKRWGNGSVMYTYAQVAIQNDDVITLTLRAKANKKVENPIFGFSIRDASGKALLGTNTQIKRKRINSVMAEDVISLEWTFPNIFNDGTYVVELAIIYPDGTVCDWWEEAKTFIVKKLERTPYLVNPATDVQYVINGTNNVQ